MRLAHPVVRSLVPGQGPGRSMRSPDSVGRITSSGRQPLGQMQGGLLGPRLLQTLTNRSLVLAALIASSSLGFDGSQGYRPGGLIYRDPRAIPWMVQDTFVLVGPVHPAADAVLAVDLSSQMPPVGNQGAQGSCAAWAIGYYQKTHYEWLEYRWDLSQTGHQFSPAFIYNQTNGGENAGCSFPDAMQLIADQGCATMADCPYNQSDFTSWPSESAYARAIPHRGGTSHWFDMSGTSGINMAKQRLENGYATAIGILTYSNFYNIQNFSYTYCVADTYGGFHAAHAATIVGYDDTMTTHDGPGAFKLVNSWGTGWGLSGFCWMSYVAARNEALSFQEGYYLDDLIGYSPTMYGRVRIAHPARDKIGIRLGVGSTASPLWSKDFRAWHYSWADRPFPGNNMVFDMTEGEPYITNGQTDSAFVRVIDDVSDSKTGSITHFAGQHRVWDVTGISADPPVNIPDHGVWVHARCALPQPYDVGVVLIIAPADTVDSGASVNPQARVKNRSTTTLSFPVTFTIGAYSDTQSVIDLAAEDSATVDFAPWTATVCGANATRCSTGLTGDNYPYDDTMGGSVIVRVPGAVEANRDSPARFAFEGGRPNPFMGTTVIRFAIPRRTHAVLSVYSAAGAFVRTLVSSSLVPAQYSVPWDGRDDRGRALPNGAYFYRLETGELRAVRRALMVR